MFTTFDGSVREAAEFISEHSDEKQFLSRTKMIVGIIAVSCIVLWSLYQLKARYDHFRIFEKLGIAGPPPSFLFGNGWDVYKLGHKEAQLKWHRLYGPVVGYFFGYDPILLIADHDILKNILFRDFINFADRPDFPGSGMEESLVCLKGQRWKQVRSTLTPSYTTSKLRQIAPGVSSIVDEFMANVDKAYESGGRSVDMYDLYQALTLETICRTALGVDFGVQKDPANSKLLRQTRAFFNFTIDLLFLVFISFPTLMKVGGALLQKVIFMRNNQGENPIVILKEQCLNMVKLRRTNPVNGRIDLLQLMLDAQPTEAATDGFNSLTAGDEAENLEKSQKKPVTESAKIDSHSGSGGKPADGCPFTTKAKPLTDSEVVDNAFVVLVAGYETTSSALAFMTRLLVRFPEVQERLREELVEATQDGSRFDFEVLQKCQYLDAVIQETLRMYPPVFAFTTRKANEEKEYDGLKISKEVTIDVSTCELQKNPEIFPNPDEFQPERFLPENRTADMMFAQQPFGAGPRNCIGMRLAQMEIKFAISKLLTKYRLKAEKFDLLNDTKINTICLPTLQRIKDPLLVTLEVVGNSIDPANKR